MNEDDIKAVLKTYILNEFLPGEDPAALTDTTALVTTGILSSLAMIKTVTFLEDQFDITIEAHETVVENLNTLSDMARLIMAKKMSPPSQ
jgi:acyl carrier protein